ncbi:MAG: hypothetical protein LPK46_01905 [Bacteroidota bacterium]|nr:hypothetical protein [Bacteroidota bacterium]MDX5504871.1 hypothetical protein [Bacteroidota bacterium]
MKRIAITVACFFVFVAPALSQKIHVPKDEPHWLDARTGQLEFFRVPLSGTDLLQVLEQQLQLPSGYHLRIRDSRIGKAGSYFLFEEMYGEYPVYSCQVKAGVDHKDQLRFIGHNLLFREVASGSSFPVPGMMALPHSLSDVEILDQYPSWFPGETDLIPSLYMNYVTPDGEHRESLISNTGKILFTRILDSYHHQQLSTGDSLVRMKIYGPDPLSVAGKSYGGSYSDQNDGNTGVLDPLRSTRFERVKFENGYFSLENPFVKIMDFEAPYSTVQTTTNGLFEFSRNHPGFEQVNAYYHITMVKNRLTTLGFPSLANFQIQVDAQAMNGADNSKFSSSTNPPRLHFGTGGVDDAEDADVIVHEYGHAILYSAAPFTNYGMERRTLDEAFGDFMAMRHSRNFKTFGYTEIFNWDGHNPFWPGRSGTAPGKNYNGLAFISIYDHTDLWADILDGITRSIGENDALEDLLESSFGYFGNMTFTQAAQLIVYADTALHSGKNTQVIWSNFRSRGVVQGNLMDLPEDQGFADVRIRNSWGFAHGEDLMINLTRGQISFQLIDIHGRIVKKGIWNEGEQRLSAEGLGAGMYFLRMDSGSHGHVEKLIRY